MGLVNLAITGDLRQIIADEAEAVADAMRRGVQGAASHIQAQFRVQALGAGFRDAGKSAANAWRVNIYPDPSRKTLHPAALIYSKMPEVVEALDTAQLIHPRKKGGWLAIPTSFNIRKVGRNGARVPFFTTEMMAALSRQKPAKANISPSRRNKQVLIWYLTVNQVGKRSVLYKRSWIERKYQVGPRGLSVRLSGKGVERSQVPMFVLIKPYTSRKRLDLESIQDGAAGVLATHLTAELSQ